MRKILLLTLIWNSCLGARPHFYVATNGNDGWSGRLPAPNASGTDGPFATLEQARDQLRLMKQTAPLTNGALVQVRGGTYYRSGTFELDPPDAGLRFGPIVYQAYPGETPVLSGARLVTNFKPWRGPILQANVAALAGLAFRQLFFNGQRQPLARFPNYVESDPYRSGWSYVDGTPTNMYVDLPNDSQSRFQYRVGDVRFWARPQEVEVFIFPRYNWFNNTLPIASVDTTSRTITLAGNADFAIRPGDRYFVRNVFEELDAPGEWYLDTQFGVLYFWPPCSAPNPVACVPVVGSPLVVLSSEYVTLHGFTLECAEGAGIGLHGATNCNVLGCTIRNVGDTGLSVFGYANSLIGNDIYSVGGEGIHLEGGVQATLDSGTNLAEDNYVHHVGVFQKGSAGISVGGVGNSVRYNLVHDCPHTGIELRGNLSVAEYNRVYHVNLETDDTGAIFASGPDWITSRGNVIRYNYVSDSKGFGFHSGQYGPPNYAWGVYLDTDAAAVDVVGNILADCSRAGIYLNNGRDNLLANNLLLNNATEQLTYGGWTSTSSEWLEYQPSMLAAYNSVCNQPAWQALRGMQLSPADAVLPDGLIMANNLFVTNILAFTNAANVYRLDYVPFYANSWSGNVVYAYGQELHLSTNQQVTTFAAWQATGYDTGSVEADPLFVDAANGDYRLQPNSPALALGFAPLPLDQIGPYQSPLRASWPIVPSLAGRLQDIRVTGADVVVRIQSAVGHNYQLRRADALQPAEWQNVGLAQNGTGDVLSFTDVGGGTAAARYYRFQSCP